MYLPAQKYMCVIASTYIHASAIFIIELPGLGSDKRNLRASGMSAKSALFNGSADAGHAFLNLESSLLHKSWE